MTRGRNLTPAELAGVTPGMPPLTPADMRLVTHYAHSCPAGSTTWASFGLHDDDTFVSLQSDRRGIWAAVERYTGDPDDRTSTTRGEHIPWARLEAARADLSHSTPAPVPVQDALFTIGTTA